MRKGSEDEYRSPAAGMPPSLAETRDRDARDRNEPSGPRLVSDSPVAEPWRDALLRLSVELPIDAGLEDIARAFLDRLTLILPGLALGACVVRPTSAAPLVLVRLPSVLIGARDRDATRLFPRLPDEQVFPLSDGAEGSTLHVACSAQVGALTPFHLQVAERAALVLGAALARARAYEQRGQEPNGPSLLELKAQLVQAEKLASLGRIVAGVVHELNNPITSILAYSDYLTRQLESGTGLASEDAERLRRISEAAERVLKFSRDLVTYARPTLEPPTALRLDDLVDKACVFCEHEFSKHDVRVDKAYGADLPELIGVSGQLIQVFVNLFTNAVHAMSRSGGVLRVEARVAHDERMLLIDVIDSGAGILPEHLPQVFDPFFTTKPDGRGTGLGLSIVRDIVNAHGGSISVQSEAGAGTTFRVQMPLA
jgi:two-component system, NtrC family, sensor kinase